MAGRILGAKDVIFAAAVLVGAALIVGIWLGGIAAL